eukprot:GHVU01173856.1.p2 GENE.GHVU01173856.1~~GHVU01173856.1.p2  ORF type:complete len:106 (+),score=3.08 GHVU01173856.1:289-606(+)
MRGRGHDCPTRGPPCLGRELRADPQCPPDAHILAHIATCRAHTCTCTHRQLADEHQICTKCISKCQSPTHTRTYARTHTHMYERTHTHTQLRTDAERDVVNENVR